jgi:hypothetical protein
VLHQSAEHLRHELDEDFAMLVAEVVESVISHLDAAADPAVGGMELDELRDLPAAADPLAGGVHP